MATAFDSLPIVDLSALHSADPSLEALQELSVKLHDVFSTTGFAYLTNAPLSFSHADVFDLARRFFALDAADKMQLAKQTFVKSNTNTYRGYFPAQPGQQDNLKEGFELGNPDAAASADGAYHPSSQRPSARFSLNEPNVWPAESDFPGGRASLETLHGELQALSGVLLSLLALSLDKPADFFASYLPGSVSTLRLLHYPPQERGDESEDGKDADEEVRLCCTPHTDSGILTLLHQDATGGLEVLSAAGNWVPAPYMPGSIVVNIGDLLGRVSGGRFVATMHRVRASSGRTGDGLAGLGRLSVPFFFEPGEACVVRSVDGGEAVVYGDHLRRKMGTWVEFQDPQPVAPPAVGTAVAVSAS